MLGFSNKKEAKVRFEEEVSNYDSNLIDLNRKIDWLHFEKGKTYSVLKDVEAYLNTLKNTPEEIVKEFNSAKLQISTYEKELDLIKKELDKIEYKAVASGVKTAAVGVAAGTTVAGFAPSAAIAVATTFGTASTGTNSRRGIGCSRWNRSAGSCDALAAFCAGKPLSVLVNYGAI